MSQISFSVISALILFIITFTGHHVVIGQEAFCETVLKNGTTTSGYCINVKTQMKACPSHYNLLKNKEWAELRKHICSTDNKRVCCPVNEFNEVQSSEEERTNRINYKTHPNFKHLPDFKSCGLSFHSTGDKIIGGNTSLPGEFPWVVRIGMRSDDSPFISYTCGGSIISKRYILSAAHCFKQSQLKLDHIRLGQSNEDLEEECIELFSNRRVSIPIPQFEFEKPPPVACGKPIDVRVEQLIVHPEYTGRTGSQADIALIRLAEDIDFNSYFTKPICLPFLDEYQVKSQLQEISTLRDEKTLVAGFGKVHNDEQTGSSTLQFVRSPIQPNIMCRISYSGYNVSPTQICAGGVAGSGSCLGDSGGPLFLPARPDTGSSKTLRSFLLGIVSYGKTRCAQENTPVVYTKVRSYLKWILDNIQA